MHASNDIYSIVEMFHITSHLHDIRYISNACRSNGWHVASTHKKDSKTPQHSSDHSIKISQIMATFLTRLATHIALFHVAPTYEQDNSGLESV